MSAVKGDDGTGSQLAVSTVKGDDIDRLLAVSAVKADGIDSLLAVSAVKGDDTGHAAGRVCREG